jgi:hypothetical protein
MSPPRFSAYSTGYALAAKTFATPSFIGIGIFLVGLGDMREYNLIDEVLMTTRRSGDIRRFMEGQLQPHAEPHGENQ